MYSTQVGYYNLTKSHGPPGMHEAEVLFHGGIRRKAKVASANGGPLRQQSSVLQFRFRGLPVDFMQICFTLYMCALVGF